MDNRKCIYFVEGECEEKMLNALKVIPSLIINGKVKKFNAITEGLTRDTYNLTVFVLIRTAHPAISIYISHTLPFLTK